MPQPRVPVDMIIENVIVPGPLDAPDVRLRIYRPRAVASPAAVLYWIHGGGFVLGWVEQDEKMLVNFARTLGIVVVSVQYRLSPRHRAPAALDDAYAGLTWLFAQADARGYDPSRVAIGGASAGGGLAAGLTLMTHDRGEFPQAFQLLVYPMLDDRTTRRTDLDTSSVRVWEPASNVFGWSSFLGDAFGTDDVSPYAAPARRVDLSGLPPTWLGVGTTDLFHDEDVEYARRLTAQGVDCETTIVDGAFHGFDMLFAKRPVAQEFWRSQARALQRALRPDLPEDVLL
ncbi:alpha/beta hydrolase [Gordonia sp. TBRC 11910]|uniref:Alpha/beta hydrolase n=2 Tax=Gordonia asplenii TaxID=2725283 RepID=A0A848KY88_9ACTN|nr:alpha/beta hydrolase [Gordonia asplenii]